MLTDFFLIGNTIIGCLGQVGIADSSQHIDLRIKGLGAGDGIGCQLSCSDGSLANTSLVPDLRGVDKACDGIGLRLEGAVLTQSESNGITNLVVLFQAGRQGNFRFLLRKAPRNQLILGNLVRLGKNPYGLIGVCDGDVGQVSKFHLGLGQVFQLLDVRFIQAIICHDCQVQHLVFIDEKLGGPLHIGGGDLEGYQGHGPNHHEAKDGKEAAL